MHPPKAMRSLRGETHDSPQMKKIPLDAIDLLPTQPRASDAAAFAPALLEKLAETIARSGLLQPLVVRPHPTETERYQLVAGERRLRALRRLGHTQAMAVVREIPDAELLETALLENLQREPLNPIEEAHAYRTLRDVHGYRQRELAARLGKERATVTNTLRLLKLPQPAQQALVRGELGAGHGRALLSCPEDGRQPLLARILREGMSVRQSELAARRWRSRTVASEEEDPSSSRHATPPEKTFPAAHSEDRSHTEPDLPKTKPTANPTVNPMMNLTAHQTDFEAARLLLERRLGRRVELHLQPQHGTLGVRFHSVEEFERIVGALEQNLR